MTIARLKNGPIHSFGQSPMTAACVNEHKIRHELKLRGIADVGIEKTIDLIKKIVSKSISLPYNAEGMLYLRKNDDIPVTLQAHINGDVYIHFKSKAASKADILGLAGQKIVYRAIHQTGEIVAASVIKEPFSERNEKTFQVEKRALEIFKGCKYVLQGFHAERYLHKNSIDLKYGLITEYCHGRADKNFLSSLKHRKKWTFFLHILEGIQAMHEKGYVHYDLKSDNILFRQTNGSYEPRIIDFGLMHAIGEKLHQVTGGARLPPEYSIRASYPLKVAAKVDVWALGWYAAIHLLNARPKLLIKGNPYTSQKSKLKAKWKKVQGKSKTFISIIKRMLDCNPNTRISLTSAIEKIKAKIK